MADLVTFQPPRGLVTFAPVEFAKSAGKQSGGSDGDITWVTIHGAHIPIGADGQPVGGAGGALEGGSGAAPRAGFRHATDEDRKRLGIGKTFARAEVAHDAAASIQETYSKWD